MLDSEQIAWIAIAALWLTYMPLGLSGLYSFVRYGRNFIANPKKPFIDLQGNSIIFQFTVRSINPKILEKSIVALEDAIFGTRVLLQSHIVIVSDK